MRLLEQHDCFIEDQGFAECVEIRFLVMSDFSSGVLASLRELSGGSAVCTPLGEVFRAVKI